MLRTIFGAWFCLLLSFSAHAELLQILHTNDLHGFFENSVAEPARGGYAQLKTVVEELKAQARDRGVESLFVDAGDFLEGNLFYMADRGRRTWEIMNKMGHDMVVVGNHDYLMGTKVMNDILKDIPPHFKYLGANFQLNNPLYGAIKKNVSDYHIVKIGGFKVAFIGLTTDEIVYKWRFKGGSIKDPLKIGERLAKRLKKRGQADFVVALTHIGLEADIKLVEKSRHIDLVVGGHSHSALFRPLYKTNKKGAQVPIVQAGSHGKYVGQLMLDVSGEGIRIVNYRLVPVFTEGERDQVVDQYVKDSRQIINRMYDEDWLSEVIGETEIPLISSDTRLSVWSAFITDSIKESVNADISFHSPGFGGSDLPVGKITREDVFQAHPRVFDFEDKFGWHIYHVEAYGVVLKSIIRLILKIQEPLAFSGVTFDLLDRHGDPIDLDTDWVGQDVVGEDPDNMVSRYFGIDGKYRIANLKVNGEPIHNFRRYRVAVNEGIVVGGLGISGVVKFLLRRISRSDITMWGALMDKIRRTGVITRDYAQKMGPLSESVVGGKRLERYEHGHYMFVPR